MGKENLEEFRKEKDTEQTEGPEAQLTFWQRYKSWILIAAAIVVIVVLAVIQASPASEDPKLTLASLNKTIATLNQSVDSRVSLVESRTVWHTNQISDLEDATTNIADSLAALPNWSPAISTLQSRMTAVETAINETSHNSTAYAVITGMSPPNINAEVYGSGNFTVILTLYGSGMLNSTVFNFYPGNYTIGGIYLAGNTTMAICLDSAWDNDEIKLAVSGCVVDYASATIGGS